jgi:hypothetical protein
MEHLGRSTVRLIVYRATKLSYWLAVRGQTIGMADFQIA